jgi:hypothetical protein
MKRHLGALDPAEKDLYLTLADAAGRLAGSTADPTGRATGQATDQAAGPATGGATGQMTGQAIEGAGADVTADPAGVLACR